MCVTCVSHVCVQNTCSVCHMCVTCVLRLEPQNICAGWTLQSDLGGQSDSGLKLSLALCHTHTYPLPSLNGLSLWQAWHLGQPCLDSAPLQVPRFYATMLMPGVLRQLSRTKKHNANDPKILPGVLNWEYWPMDMLTLMLHFYTLEQYRPQQQ